ncbi:N-acetyltransferase [Enterobacter sp. R1(2018)]|uniref:GNAT family N-acetyltransferase n=1 Tax=Enterobacter sp. R1(2018) TaxID=2447891 RepID=UPI00217DD4F0|nr:GNAT family N-acetyltransferase [Enterobacter sp. R1(2018)]
MHNTVISKAAANWSSYQLAHILSHCFEGYLVPFTIDGETFASRFSAEDISLNDSKVWLQDGEPKALALVARRGQTSRLAAFAIRPELRGQGYGKRFIQQLLDEARSRADRQMWLEVIVGNDGGLALYKRMGFVCQADAGGFSCRRFCAISAHRRAAGHRPALMAKKMMTDSRLRLPWLSAPETLYKLPGKAYVLDDVAYAMVIPHPQQPRLRMLYVDTAARGKGQAKKLLTLLHERFPGLSTAGSVPEQVAPLYLSCGYRQDPVTQYEMLLKF